MKIGLIGCWHDDNRGDSAILIGLLNDLYALRSDLNISAFSIFSDANGPFKVAFRHILSLFPQLRVYPSIIPDPYNPSLGRLQRSLRVKSMIYRSLCLMIRSYRSALAPFVNSDLVISVGGYRFKSYRDDIVDLVRIIFHSLPLFIAQRYGKPYIIDAQSIGPIRGKVHRKIIQRALQGAIVVGLREPLSFKEVRSMGLSNLRLIPDSAFSLRPLLSDRVLEFMRKHSLLNRSYIVLVPRQWFFRDHIRYQDYIRTMVRFIKRSSAYEHLIVLVPNSIGPIPIEDDRKICYDIAFQAKSPNLIIVDEDWNAPELAAFYGHSDVIISVRLHAVILASLSGVPAVAISYEGFKTRGIMDLIGLRNFVLDISDLNVEELISKLEDVSQMTDLIRSNLQNVVSEMRRKREDFIREFIL